MNRTFIRVVQQYELALGKNAKLGSWTDLPLARRVGKQAAALRWRPLDLARVHDQALAKLGLPVSRDGALHRADAFFAEALAHLQCARKAAARLRQLNKRLRQRTMALASARRIRKQGLVDRNALKHALKKKTEHYASLLAESRDLQRWFSAQANLRSRAVAGDPRSSKGQRLLHALDCQTLG